MGLHPHVDVGEIERNALEDTKLHEYVKFCMIMACTQVPFAETLIVPKIFLKACMLRLRRVFGLAVSAERRVRDMSQANLAERVNLNISQVSMLERGTRA